MVAMEGTLIHEKIWADKYKYDDAERIYFENLGKLLSGSQSHSSPSNIKCSVKLPTVLIENNFWLDKYKYDDAEKLYYENIPVLHIMKGVEALTSLCSATHVITPITFPSAIEKRFKVKDKRDKNKKSAERKTDKLIKEDRKVSSNILKNTLSGEVAKARQHIKSSLECMDGIAQIAANNSNSVDIHNRINTLEKENIGLKQDVKDLTALLKILEQRITALEKKTPATTSVSTTTPKSQNKSQVEEDEDDGVDLFGSDSEEEDNDAKKVKEQRLAEYAARKSKKPALIAKSNIILDVKPWDDETDMKQMEAEVRKIECDGLIWGASKLVPLAYGIHKLQISCVVEDDKVSVDWLQETIEAIEDYVQSVDIAAFNKV